MNVQIQQLLNSCQSSVAGTKVHGVPIGYFLDILPLKKADAESIYTFLMKRLKDENFQASKISGMGFAGASIFP